jgi:hypothetical protein
MIAGKTEADRARRGAQLYARCARELGYENPCAAAFAGWLANRRPSLRTATWHVYRAAAIFVIEGVPDPDTAAALELLRGVAAPSGPRPARRTSAKRAKCIAPGDLIALLQALGRSRSQYATALRDWLIAGILTGLRPCEWRSASLNRRCLHVENAKYIEGKRGLGPTRDLDLSTLALADFKAVARMVARAQGWVADAEYVAHQQACGDLLRSVNINLWPGRTRRVTLYTPRHQFAASGKAGDPAELAAAMGHICERSAYRSYGRAAAGWGKKAPPRPGVASGATAAVRRNGPSRRSDPIAPTV